MEFQLQRWKNWWLMLFQRARYMETYCLPSATFIASTYPPPVRLLKEVVTKICTFVLGMPFFPLVKAEMYSPVEQGGLGARAVRLVVAAQQQQQQQPGNTASVALRGSLGRVRSYMGRLQVSVVLVVGGRDGGWVPAHGGPQGDPAVVHGRGGHWTQELKILARLCWWQQQQQQGEEGEVVAERHIQAQMYGNVVDRELRAAAQQRLLRGTTLAAYCLNAATAAAVFQPREVPVNLWELRWRAFHQLLCVGATQPWLAPCERACPRQCCQRQPEEETVRHLVTQCPTTRVMWAHVAAMLHWPALADQHWEMVVSGLEPQEGGGSERPNMTRGSQGRRIPWQVVQLVNLYTIKAIMLHRAKEIQGPWWMQASTGPWEAFVLKQLQGCRRGQGSMAWQRK